MDTERWEKIENLFNSALELSHPAERTEFLVQAETDPEIRSEVISLLESFESADVFFSTDNFSLGLSVLRKIDERTILPEDRQVGFYRIRRLLGRGGMGEVYLAEDTRLKRLAALKILSSHLISLPAETRRFQLEAQSASAIAHPNVAHIYEVGEADNLPFIAMEYVPGQTLREKLQAGELKSSEIFEIAIQIGAALVAAHKEGIIHRDIKPENIIINDEGLVKVLDFGLAKSVRDVKSASAAKVGEKKEPIIGTPAYMSPEQIQGQPLGPATDVWSFGAVLFEMLAGRPLFISNGAKNLKDQILRHEPEGIREIMNGFDLPAELTEILVKSLEKESEARYANMQELLQDLRPLANHHNLQSVAGANVLPAIEIAASGNDHSIELNRSAFEKIASGKSFGTTAKVLSKASRNKRKFLFLSVLFLIILVIPTGIYCYYSFYRIAENRRPSIAVLPFTNVVENPETEYLSDGISDSLITDLSYLSGVKVIAKSSSFKFKGKDLSINEIGRRLSVGTILMGSISMNGPNFVIEAELVDAGNGTHIWGEHFDRQLGDLQAVRNEIAQKIISELRLQLTVPERDRLISSETSNPEAYELLLKNRYFWSKGDTENRKKAIAYIQRAIEIDPAYASAYAEFSAELVLLINNSVYSPREYMPEAEAAARKALEIDPDSADAHYALALLKRSQWDWNTAGEEYRRTLELNPHLLKALNGQAYFFAFTGNFDGALADSRHAHELDPVSISTLTDSGNLLYLARRFDEGIIVLNSALELDPGYAAPYVTLGYIYSAKKMPAQAVECFNKAIQMSGETTSRLIFLGAAYAAAGDSEKAHEILKKLETTKDYVSSCELSILYAALGEKDKALVSLEKAYTAHDLQLQYLKVDPAFDSLRQEDQFQDLIKRVGFPD